MDHTVVAVAVLLLLCKYSSAQDGGGCSPSPPTNLLSSVQLWGNRVPMILTDGPEDILRPLIGGHGTDSWAMFSATQVRQHGLWCQVRPENNNATAVPHIGDWYYPTNDGYTLLLPNKTYNSTPYQSFKCNNQIGVVVDGDVTNYQGIMKCNTTVSNLIRDTNYIAVYDDNIFNNYTGPVVEPRMALTLLSSRDALNVVFKLSFNVSFGPPSRIYCTTGMKHYNYDRSGSIGLFREAIRSQYVNSSLPDVTRVTIQVEQLRKNRTYTCEVTVEGRTNIIVGPYNYESKGSRISSVNITVAGTPTSVTANRTGYASVMVSWTAPSVAPAGYEVFYQTTAGVSSRVSGGNTTNAELLLTGLTLGETYYIFVVAYGPERDPVLPSFHSNNVSVPLSIPVLSSTLILNYVTPFIVATWFPPEFTPDNYSVSTSCKWFCDSKIYLSSTALVSDTSTNPGVSHKIPHINAGSRCTVSVLAVFGSNTSNTITSSMNTPVAVPTGDPQGLNITSKESRSLVVVWGTVLCPHQRGSITGYRLRYSNGTSIVNATGEESRYHNLTGLTPFTSYSMQVAAVNTGGTGPYTVPAFTVLTLQDVPGPVSGFSAISGVVQVTISWSPPLEPNGIIIEYEISFNSSGVFSYTNTSATQHILREIPPNTFVTFSVRAYTIVGPGENVTGQASTGSVPIVSGVSVVALNSTTAVRVSWTPVNLPSVVDHYTVHYITVGGTRGTLTFPGITSSGVVSGLQGGQQYQFSVTVTLNVDGEFFTRSPNYTQYQLTVPFPRSSSSTVLLLSLIIGLGVGWVCFLVTMVGCIIVSAVLMRVVKQHRSFELPPSAPNITGTFYYDEKIEIKQRRASSSSSSSLSSSAEADKNTAVCTDIQLKKIEVSKCAAYKNTSSQPQISAEYAEIIHDH